MQKRNVDGNHSSFGYTLLDEKYRVIAGRTAVVLGLFSFIATYIYGISAFGAFVGIAVGWLPSALIAWMVVIVVHAVAGHIAKFGATTWHQLSLLVR